MGILTRLADYINIIDELLYRTAFGSVVILTAFWILSIIFSSYILPTMLKYTSRTETNIDNKLILATGPPIRVLLLVVGIYLALLNLPLSLAMDSFLHRCFRTIIIIILAWTANNITGSDSVLSDKLKAKFQLDSLLIPLFSKMIKFVIIAMAIVLAAHEWGYDVNGFIAGLGLGGLAFALAAKDALANIFGGIVILMEKPFAIDDWVQTPSVEGTVEEITFRSTRFRTFAHALVTVPNSSLANEPITNWSRMGKRRVTFNLSIDYAGPRAKIEKCIQEIRNILKVHPKIHPETILVYLENININSLDILIYFFTKTTDWEEYLAIKEEVNFKILDILAQENIPLAFPGRHIYSDISVGERIISR